MVALFNSFSRIVIFCLYPFSIFYKLSCKLFIISLFYFSILVSFYSISLFSFLSCYNLSSICFIYFFICSLSLCFYWASLYTSSVFYYYCSICNFNCYSTLICCRTSASSLISIFSYPSAYLSIFFCFAGSSLRLARLDDDESRSIFTFSKSLLSFFRLFPLGSLIFLFISSFSFSSCAFLNFSWILQFSLNYSNSSILICISISTDCLM